MKLALVPLIFSLLALPLAAQTPVGTLSTVGTLANPKTVNRLEITKPGVYENYRVDAQGKGGNIVKITADNVTVRNCEIFNGSGNGIGVFGTKVVIENCRIHHLLKATYQQQEDAHGITGHWGDVTIRNCDISHTSGDCIQFDPERASQGRVVIEDCHLWTSPLDADAAGFKAGESPGENAVDTKTKPAGERCQLIIRNCYLHGFRQPSQIQNRAALNLKEHIDAEVTHCVLADNEIAIRARGPGGQGNARVTIKDCAFYNTQVAVRAEDKIEQLKLIGLAFGAGVKTRLEKHNGKDLPGFENTGEREAPPLETLLMQGFSNSGFKTRIERSRVRQNAGFPGVHPHSGECGYGFEIASTPTPGTDAADVPIQQGVIVAASDATRAAQRLKTLITQDAGLNFAVVSPNQQLDAGDLRFVLCTKASRSEVKHLLPAAALSTDLRPQGFLIFTDPQSTQAVVVGGDPDGLRYGGHTIIVVTHLSFTVSVVAKVFFSRSRRALSMSET